VRICGYFLKPESVREQKSLENTGLISSIALGCFTKDWTMSFSIVYYRAFIAEPQKLKPTNSLQLGTMLADN
jgi:hypothetical protein